MSKLLRWRRTAGWERRSSAGGASPPPGLLPAVRLPSATSESSSKRIVQQWRPQQAAGGGDDAPVRDVRERSTATRRFLRGDHGRPEPRVRLAECAIHAAMPTCEAGAALHRSSAPRRSRRTASLLLRALRGPGGRARRRRPGLRWPRSPGGSSTFTRSGVPHRRACPSPNARPADLHPDGPPSTCTVCAPSAAAPRSGRVAPAGARRSPRPASVPKVRGVAPRGLSASPHRPSRSSAHGAKGALRPRAIERSSRMRNRRGTRAGP